MYFIDTKVGPSVTKASSSSSSFVVLAMSDEQQVMDVMQTSSRGVSVDQDGKSNVWAIEPKMEVSSKSSDEKTQSALIAGGGIVGALGLAAVILTNLPDPNQF